MCRNRFAFYTSLAKKDLLWAGKKIKRICELKLVAYEMGVPLIAFSYYLFGNPSIQNKCFGLRIELISV